MAGSGNHFDANAYVQAMELPTLTLPPRRKGGKPLHFTGRFVSLPQFTTVNERLTLYRKGQLPPDELVTLIRDMTDLIFGKPPWWAPWRPWASVELAKLPLKLQLDALQRFIESQVTALRSDAAAPATETTTAAAS